MDLDGDGWGRFGLVGGGRPDQRVGGRIEHHAGETGVEQPGQRIAGRCNAFPLALYPWKAGLISMKQIAGNYLGDKPHFVTRLSHMVPRCAPTATAIARWPRARGPSWAT